MRETLPEHTVWHDLQQDRFWCGWHDNRETVGAEPRGQRPILHAKRRVGCDDLDTITSNLNCDSARASSLFNRSCNAPWHAPAPAAGSAAGSARAVYIERQHPRMTTAFVYLLRRAPRNRLRIFLEQPFCG